MFATSHSLMLQYLTNQFSYCNTILVLLLILQLYIASYSLKSSKTASQVRLVTKRGQAVNRKLKAELTKYGIYCHTHVYVNIIYNTGWGLMLTFIVNI